MRNVTYEFQKRIDVTLDRHTLDDLHALLRDPASQKSMYGQMKGEGKRPMKRFVCAFFYPQMTN